MASYKGFGVLPPDKAIVNCPRSLIAVSTFERINSSARWTSTDALEWISTVLFMALSTHYAVSLQYHSELLTIFWFNSGNF
jgi:hypothetical protein